MCGRYALTSSLPGLARRLAATLDSGLEGLAPRYNAAPGQDLPVVRPVPGGGREIGLLRWGLVPHWARGRAAERRPINARAETARDKPMFRDAIRRRRCLVPADGYYEWQALGGRRQPWLIARAEGAPLLLAGLWECNEAGEEPLETFAILTTAAGGSLARLHARTPLLLAEDALEAWLDPELRDPRLLTPLREPPALAGLIAHPVSTHVNDPRNDDPRCCEPSGPPLEIGEGA